LSFIVESIISGIVVASAFPIGAWIALRFNYSKAKVALFAAFGAGIFFAATMLLVQETLNIGNIFDMIVGFALGAAAFGLAQHYFKHSPRSNNSNAEGRLTIVGTILDSVPETLFVGIIIALRESGLVAAIIVLFLGNFATTLMGAKLMANQGIKGNRILRDWFFDFLIVAVAAPVGYFLTTAVVGDFISAILGFAVGTLMVFISGELIVAAYRESTGHWEDLSLSIGFIVGVILLFVI
jgi:zinc transporter, ZIP family